MIVSIDTETFEYNESEGVYRPVLDARKFVLGCAKAEGKQPVYFNDHNKMYKWLMSLISSNIKRGKRTFVYAHNMKYDWYAIAKDNLINDDTNYIAFDPFIAIIKDKGYILDTGSFFRMSLKDLGDILKCPKLNMPDEVKLIGELQPYILRDVEIVYNSMVMLKSEINKLGYNPRKFLTAGQLSMTSFLTHCRRTGEDRIFMRFNHDIKQKTIIKTKYPDLVRLAYRGANNTAFQVGTFEDATLIDINGCYAKAMCDIGFPLLDTEKYIDNPSVGLLQRYLNKETGVAQCELEAPNIPFGYLPIRYAGYQMFPVNRKLIGTWTFPELKKAVLLGYKINSCRWAIRYKISEHNPFNTFINKLYDIEKSKNTYQEKMVLKLIRNNLYGKFAQNRSRHDFMIVSRVIAEQYLDKGYRVVGSIDEKYILSKKMEPYDPSYSNPIISALITAEARDRLYNAYSNLPKEDVLYCDTDSVMFKGDHIKRFVLSNELGDFKLEKRGKAKILGEKRYYIEDKVSLSGVPKEMREHKVIDTGEPIIVPRMIGLGSIFTGGRIEDVGSFYEHKFEIGTETKIAIPLLSVIDET